MKRVKYCSTITYHKNGVMDGRNTVLRIIRKGVIHIRQNFRPLFGSNVPNSGLLQLLSQLLAQLIGLF